MVKQIFTIVLFTIIGLLGIEIFFQQTGAVSSTLTGYSEEFGTLNKSNFRWVKFKEGFYLGKTTEDGLLHEPYGKVDTTAQLKIGLIGDSFVAGDDVFDRSHFGNIFEDSLKTYFKDINVDVLNFGRGNFSLPASYYYYKNFTSKYNLDYIIYFFESRDYYPSGPPFVKYFTLENDSLVTNIKGEESMKYKTLKYLNKYSVGKIISESSLLALLSRDMYALKSRGFKKKFLEKFRSWEILLNVKKEEEESAWYNPYTTNAKISDFTKFIIDDLVNQEKPKVIFVTRHHPVRVPQLDEYFEEKNYPYYSLTEIFDGTIIKENKEDAHFFKASQSYGGHFNHEGHEALGKFLAKRFLADYSNEINNELNK